MQNVHEKGYEIVSSEQLYLFDGVPAFSAPEG
jgi:hypothetical protein